ncbi:putative 1, partial [Tropilaelaps mercedesae]
VWNSYHRTEQVGECFQRSAMALGVDYVDLYLMHWPFAFREGHEGRAEDGLPSTTDIDFLDCWRGMEELYVEGKVRNIGVSNFNSEQVARLLANCTIKPLVNQVEANIYINQEKLRAFCSQRGVTLTAYSPLGSPGNKRNPDAPNPLDDPLVAYLAARHKKTSAQVLLRFLIQRCIAVIPKSCNPQRIRENIEVFDFHLNPKEMASLMALNRGYRRFGVDNLKDHKFYPFNIEF